MFMYLDINIMCTSEGRRFSQQQKNWPLEKYYDHLYTV